VLCSLGCRFWSRGGLANFHDHCWCHRNIRQRRSSGRKGGLSFRSGTRSAIRYTWRGFGVIRRRHRRWRNLVKRQPHIDASVSRPREADTRRRGATDQGYSNLVLIGVSRLDRRVGVVAFRKANGRDRLQALFDGGQGLLGLRPQSGALALLLDRDLCRSWWRRWCWFWFGLRLSSGSGVGPYVVDRQWCSFRGIGAVACHTGVRHAGQVRVACRM
jgi:hypothetical protein